MSTINYNLKCNKNKDCDSNACELIYENDKPIGRFCLVSSEDKKYTKKCDRHRECNSNKCEKIYDANGHYLTKKCVKAPKKDNDTAYNNLFGSDRSNKYGIMNANSFGTNDLSDNYTPGPMSELIQKILSIIGDLFHIIVYNPTKMCQNGGGVCDDNCIGECAVKPTEEQGILYSIWRSIFDAIFMNVMKTADRSIFFGGINAKNYDTCSGKCTKERSRPIDLWYLRVFVTILFPPFGVFLSRGLNGLIYIIICCVLTCFFYFPGLIYALAVMSVSVPDIADQKKVQAPTKNKNKDKDIDMIDRFKKLE